MKDAKISSYFDTKYMAVLQIEQILHSFEDNKSANFSTMDMLGVMNGFKYSVHTFQSTMNVAIISFHGLAKVIISPMGH